MAIQTGFIRFTENKILLASYISVKKHGDRCMAANKAEEPVKTSETSMSDSLMTIITTTETVVIWSFWCFYLIASYC